MTASTGASAAGPSGDVLLSTGNATSGAGGDISMAVGEGDLGEGGNVFVTAGTTTDTTHNGGSVSFAGGLGEGSMGSGGGHVLLSGGESQGYEDCELASFDCSGLLVSATVTRAVQHGCNKVNTVDPPTYVCTGGVVVEHTVWEAVNGGCSQRCQGGQIGRAHV